MTFAEAASCGMVVPPREYDPEFCRVMRAVASGRMSVEEARQIVDALPKPSPAERLEAHAARARCR